MEDLAKIGIKPNRFMPELPEVETVKNVLLPIVKGRKITQIDILRSSIIKNNPKDIFSHGLIGETILDVSRIGKFLIFHLTNEKVMISHLRMEGKYFEILENEKPTKYARVIFHFDNGHRLCYDDSRTFGMLKLSSESQYLKEKEIAQLGPEPFFADAKTLKEKTIHSHTPIKSTLLDQTLMTGLGNIYADEVCYACHIHPLTETNKISLSQWEDIVINARRILNEAIASGGSTIRSYHPGKGIDGNFQTSLLAYGKKDEPCPRCGHYFRFIKVGGRGSTFCPHCQIRHGKPIKVAIFGPSGVGKSVILQYLAKQNYATISADEVVNQLYERKEIIDKINKLFNLSFDNKIDKALLRQYLIDHPKDIRKLNNLIHPLVKKEIEQYINKQKMDFVFAEVPLLFEAKMENDFDIWLAVDINQDQQIERLNKRNKKSAQDIKTINSYSKFDIYKKKADFVINNNTDLKSLYKQIDNLINKWQDRLN